MLGKLLKYEVKAAGKVIPVLYLGIGLAYLLGKLAAVLHVAQMKTGLAVICLCMGVAAIVLALILAVLRYAKGLFGSEGYLAQTLPVGKGTLLASKMIAGYLLILLGIVGLLLGLAGMMDLFELGNIWELLVSGLGDMFLPLLILLGAGGLIQMFSTLSTVYFAVTLSNTKPFLSNNVLFAVVFYLAGGTVVGLVELASMLLLPIGIRLSGDGGLTLTFESMLLDLIKNPELWGSSQDLAVFEHMSLGLGSVIADLAVGIFLVCITRWLLTRKSAVK